MHILAGLDSSSDSSSTAYSIMQISKNPVHHPDCCVGISEQLLENIISVLPHAPQWTLSIGSGSGLFESALLQHAPERLDVRGVEVSLHVNKHLPESNIYLVSGTWALCSHAASASAWLFVYPREPRLLSLYIARYAHGSLECIVWLGPRCDWEDYVRVFAASLFNAITIVENCGAASYEMMAIARRP